MSEEIENHLDQASPEQPESAHLNGKKLVFDSGVRGGVIGVKVGMTQIYSSEGNAMGVTVIQIPVNVVTQIKTPQVEKYSAIQVGCLNKKIRSTSLAEQGHLKPSGHKSGFYCYQEFRFPNTLSWDPSFVGQELSLEFLKPGDYVDLTAYNKGKGFQGGVKRYHMAGGYKSHGASLSHRQLGSIGNRADPGKCFKNKKMAGQMGNRRVTVQKVEVVQVDLEHRFILVKGSVPGSTSNLVTIRPTLKNQISKEQS